MIHPAAQFSIGLDVGTQSTKALAVDLIAHRIVARAASDHELIADPREGIAEQHPDQWLAAVQDALASLARQGVPLDRVVAVGVSGQQHGLVLLDHAGRVVRPAKLWCDTSTADEAAELTQRFGTTVPVGFTASKVLWLQRREPLAWQQTATVMLPHDYINFRLTGRPCMEVGDASGTGFFDLDRRCFDDRLVNLLGGGLASRLPPLIQAPALAGTVSPDGAAWSRLPPGCPVAAGGGDNMMSAIGSGAFTPGVCVLSLGTSATAFAHADSPTHDPRGLIPSFCASCGGWLPLLCTMNATGVIEEVRAALNRSHAELTALASHVPPGCHGLLWLPFHVGERVPNLPHATGTISGIRPGWLSPGTLYRAAIEAVSLNLSWGLQHLQNLGLTLRHFRVVGGGARNPLWNQVLADLLNAPVTPLLEPDSAALGAAIQAAWSIGPHHSRSALQALAEPLTPLAQPVMPSAQADLYRRLQHTYDDALRRTYRDATP